MIAVRSTEVVQYIKLSICTCTFLEEFCWLTFLSSALLHARKVWGWFLWLWLCWGFLGLFFVVVGLFTWFVCGFFVVVSGLVLLLGFLFDVCYIVEPPAGVQCAPVGLWLFFSHRLTDS